MARAGICICRGGIVLTHLALVAGAGGVQQLGVSDVRPHAGRGGQEAPKGRRFKSISRSAARPTRGPGTQQSPVPGSRARLWVTGTGLHRSLLHWGGCAAGGAGAVSAAVGGHRGRRLLFILVKMRACSCRAGGPAAHDPGSMGLKLEGGRRAAHSSTLHHAGSAAPPGQSPPLLSALAAPPVAPGTCRDVRTRVMPLAKSHWGRTGQCWQGRP